MPRPRLSHVTARLRSREHSLLVDERARWLWGALRRMFPDALAAVVMPDHVHVVAPVADAGAMRRSLGRVLGNYTRRFAFERGHWRALEAPTPIRHRTMLALTVRYVVLNPCRARLAADPLSWRWSTYRDVMGAVVDPWVTADALARALGIPRRGFRVRHHAFVTRDPHVSSRAAPLPAPAPPRDSSIAPLETIAAAAAAAFRQPPGAVRRPGRVRALFIALAAHQGWRDRRLLMAATGAAATTVKRLRGAPVNTAAFDAARRCLADPRLRD